MNILAVFSDLTLLIEGHIQSRDVQSGFKTETAHISIQPSNITPEFQKLCKGTESVSVMHSSEYIFV